MCLVFAAVCGLSLVAESKGFSCCGIQAPEHRLSSCGAWAYLLCGMWHLPWPRYEPMTPASAGRLSTTGPQGKSRKSRFLIAYFFVFSFFMESFNWESPGFCSHLYWLHFTPMAKPIVWNFFSFCICVWVQFFSWKLPK